MNLNTIELPDSVIGELYGDSLLITAKGVTTATSQALSTTATSQTAPPAEAPRQSPAGSPSVPDASFLTTKSSAYKFLGNNRKKITILVDSPQTAFLPDDQLAFLSKMLEACKMNLADVAIVNQAGSPVEIATLKRQLSPSFFLLFGPGPADIQLPIHFPLFKIQAFDGCTYLWLPSLAGLAADGNESKLLKTKLWASLKALFEL